MTADLLQPAPGIKALAYPTRGGLRGALEASLKEGAWAAGFGKGIEHDTVPGSPAVEAAWSLLRLDALLLANEGALPAALGAHPRGRDAAMIGHCVADRDRFARLPPAAWRLRDDRLAIARAVAAPLLNHSEPCGKG